VAAAESRNGSVSDVLIFYVVNRRGLDITLLAEPSSDEDSDELTMKRKKCNSRRQRRKRVATSSAVVRDKEGKADIKPPLPAAVSASVSSHSAADTDSTSQTVSADNKPVSPVRTRKRLRSLCHFLIFLFLDVNCSLK